jgi:hypothetical protein
VLNTRTGRSRAVVAPGAGCRPAAVGGNALLFDCPSTTSPGLGEADEPVLVSLATGAPKPLPAAAAAALGPYASPVDTSVTWSGVGDRWLLGRFSQYHVALTVFVDRRTLAVRRDTDDPRLTPDLDATGLMTPVCPPLRRAPGDRGTTDAVDPLLALHVDHGWALTTRIYFRSVLLTPGPYTSMVSTLGFEVRACGTGRRVVARRTAGDSATLSEGIVTWADGDGGWALDLATRRRLHWPIAYPGGVTSIVHTGGAVAMVRTAHPITRRAWGVYLARPALKRPHAARPAD